MGRNTFGGNAAIGRRQPDEFAKNDNRTRRTAALGAVGAGAGYAGGRQNYRNIDRISREFEQGVVHGVPMATKHERQLASNMLRRRGTLAGAAALAAPSALYTRAQRQTERKAKVIKRERVYDAHDARQRRMGMMTAGGALGGGLLIASGVRGVGRATKATKEGRKAMSSLSSHDRIRGETAWHHGDEIPADSKAKVGGVRHARTLTADEFNAVRAAPGSGVVVRGRDAAKVGGGAAALGVSGELARRGRSDSNRRWR